ncbi:hypothetical protein RMATCC62417_11830 [Rhizopus microsporus]|nr:hypothetical protein RMATCC62417_11830 [Rhizopus microsporus]
MLLFLSLHFTPTSRLPEDGQSPPSLGKGIWRAHPRLATSRSFRDQLHKAVSAGISSFPYSMSVQCQWDAIKVIAKREAQRYSRHQTFSLTTTEKMLQHKRSAITKRILDTPTSSPQLSSQLQLVEHQLAPTQQHHVDNLALQSGLGQREHGEISAGYLKRTVTQRQHKKLFKAIKHPYTSILCTSKNCLRDETIFVFDRLYYSQIHHRPLFSQDQLFNHNSSSETWWPWFTGSFHTTIRAPVAMAASAAETFSSFVRILALGRAHFFHYSASPSELSHSPCRAFDATPRACSIRF